MHIIEVKNKARQLRSQGKTYAEINSLLELKLPKSTLATWCRKIKLPSNYNENIRRLCELNLSKAREISKESKKQKKIEFLKWLEKENANLFKSYANNFQIQKIVLSILYLAEGSKSPRGALMFGNSDSQIVATFVNLMRKCYKIDESKFRCTVQCRADQNIPQLEDFWSVTTKIPLKQFYKARIDKRTISQPSRKKDYKGVCRVDYFSSAIDMELKYIGKTLMLMGL